MYVQVQTPPGATAERTQIVVNQVTRYLREQEKDNVESVFSVTGFNFAGRGQNAAMMFVKLTDWSLRPNSTQTVGAIADRKSVAWGRSVSVRVDVGGRRVIEKKKTITFNKLWRQEK